MIRDYIRKFYEKGYLLFGWLHHTKFKAISLNVLKSFFKLHEFNKDKIIIEEKSKMKDNLQETLSVAFLLLLVPSFYDYFVKHIQEMK